MLQYLVVPKNARIIFPNIRSESTHKTARAASNLFSYVIYIEYISFLFSGFILVDNIISIIFPYCPKYFFDFSVPIFAKDFGKPWTWIKFCLIILNFLSDSAFSLLKKIEPRKRLSMSKYSFFLLIVISLNYYYF